MSKKTILQFVFFLTLLCTKSMYADEKPLRILELIPETWFEYPVIEPAIPDNYILGSEEINCCNIWGTKEDVEAFSKNIYHQVERPLFTLRHSYEIVQTGPESFSQEETIVEAFSRVGVKDINIIKLKWGEYPVLAIEGNMGGKPMRLALIGLNSPNRFVIHVTFISSSNEQDSSEIWKTFLRDTRPLDEKEFLKAMGMEMEEGYTFYRSGKAKVKAIAEKRKNDGKIAVKVEPITPNTSFRIIGFNESTMVTEWKNGEPCVEMLGEMVEKYSETGETITEAPIIIHTKFVDQFSIDPSSLEVLIQ